MFKPTRNSRLPRMAPAILLNSKESIAQCSHRLRWLGRRAGPPAERGRDSWFACAVATRISGRELELASYGSADKGSADYMAGNVIILIPARMAATRLPGKPLAEIAGRPMIAHVMDQAAAAGVGPVFVATDSAEIAAAVTKAGGRGGLTRPDKVS